MHEPMRCLRVAFFSRTAAVTSAVFPVKSSAPVTSVIISPKGKPKAPLTMFCRPGLVAAKPGQAPPTASISQAPKPMCAPEIMPRAKILLGAMPAFLVPAATAPSYPAGGSARDAAGAAAWATRLLARTARTGDAAKRDGCEATSPCSELVQMARMVSLHVRGSNSKRG